MKSFKYLRQTLRITKEKYNTNDTLCLTLIDKSDDVFIVLSANLSSFDQKEDRVFINQSGEELEIAEILVGKGVLIPVALFATSGYNTYQLYAVVL